MAVLRGRPARVCAPFTETTSWALMASLRSPTSSTTCRSCRRSTSRARPQAHGCIASSYDCERALSKARLSLSPRVPLPRAPALSTNASLCGVVLVGATSWALRASLCCPKRSTTCSSCGGSSSGARSRMRRPARGPCLTRVVCCRVRVCSSFPHLLRVQAHRPRRRRCVGPSPTPPSTAADAQPRVRAPRRQERTLLACPLALCGADGIEAVFSCVCRMLRISAPHSLLRLCVCSCSHARGAYVRRAPRRAANGTPFAGCTHRSRTRPCRSCCSTHGVPTPRAAAGGAAMTV